MSGYDLFKRLRNDVRQFNRFELATLAFSRCRVAEKYPVEEQIRRKTGVPHVFLYLARIALVFGKDEASDRPLLERNIRRLYNKAHAVVPDGFQKSLQQKHAMNRVALMFAHQQFEYQAIMNAYDLVRNLHLYDGLKFTLKNGNVILIDELLPYLFMIWIHLNESKIRPLFPEKYFRKLDEPHFDNIQRIIEGISVTLPQAIDLAKQSRFPKDPQNWSMELSPFSRRPAIRREDGAVMFVSKRLFEIFCRDEIRQLVWTRNKEIIPHAAINMERYVGQLLSEVIGVRLDETAIQEQYGSGKVVDFYFEEGDYGIMVEVKMTELRPDARISPDDSTLRASTKNSIVRGIAQYADFKKRVQTSSNFLLLVTYGNHYLGPGKASYEIIMQEEEGEYSVDDPENIFIISIQEFERLMGVIQSGNHSVVEILVDAKEKNRDPSTANFTFGMHLQDYEQDVSILESTNQEFNKVVDKAESLLKMS